MTLRVSRRGVLSAMAAAPVLGAVSARAQSGGPLTRYVDPFIGTDGTGHTFPGPCRPFGMVQPGPDNADSGWDYAAILLDPPRPALRAAIAGRFAAMLEAGALAEVRALLALGLDPALPAMRAHGVPELAAYLRGDLTLAEASRRAELVTGQYTKRQATWFRHRPLAPPAHTHTIHARFAGLEQFSERESAKIFAFIQSAGLTQCSGKP